MSTVVNWQLKYEVVLKNLTSTQERCTELLNEIRALRAQHAPKGFNGVQIDGEDCKKLCIMVSLDTWERFQAFEKREREAMEDGGPSPRGPVPVGFNTNCFYGATGCNCKDGL